MSSSGVETVPSRHDVLASFEDGVTAVANLSSRVEDWSVLTPCPDWSAADLAGHLLSIVRYYHRLLDAALSGAPMAALPRGGDLAAMNAVDLLHMEDSSGPARISEFVGLAISYGARLAEIGEVGWEQMLGAWDGLGPLTVGQHTGIAIGEWHVHAWDLAAVSSCEHRPADPLTVAQGQVVLGRVDLTAGDPWSLALNGYGRVAS